MFFNKNKNDFKLIIKGETFIKEIKQNEFISEKSFKNRIKLSSFLLGLKYELNKFNKNIENSIFLTKEEIEKNFQKMTEIFQNESNNYLFIKNEDNYIVIDNIDIEEVIVLNKNGKPIFNKKIKDLTDKDMELI